MNKLEIAKKLIAEHYADAGIFNTENLVGDSMVTLYDSDGLVVNLCYEWAYFEVFGLTNDEFAKLREYYKSLQ